VAYYDANKYTDHVKNIEKSASALADAFANDREVGMISIAWPLYEYEIYAGGRAYVWSLQ
jgi:hypothetical protein